MISKRAFLIAIIGRLRRILLALVLCIVVPISARAQGAVSIARGTAPPSTTMQSAATGNGNGTVLNVSGYQSALLNVVCSVSCSGGTTVNFEASVDGTSWTAISAWSVGSASITSTTTADGDFALATGPYQQVRARISSYSAGTVTVKGYPSAWPLSQPITSVTDGSGALNVICDSGCTSASDTDDGSIAGGQSVGLNAALANVWSGAAWVRLTQGQATMAASVPVAIASNQSALTVSATDFDIRDLTATDTVTVTDGAGALNVIVDSGSVTANAGTNLNTSALLTTTAHDAALGTAGTADAQVRTVQGIAAMTPLLVDGSATTQPVSATNLDVQSGGADLATETTAAAILTSTNFAAAFGTAGTADTQVLSVQGIASMTALTVTGTNLDVQSGGADLALEAGGNLAAVRTAVELIDNAISGAGFNITQFAGTGAQTGSGTATGALRVELPTNGTGVVGLNAGTAIVGKVGIDQTTPGTTNAVAISGASGLGATTLSHLSVGLTEDEHAVCAAPCTLYSIAVTNTNAAVRYIKCENDTVAGTAPGTDTPEFRMAVPGATTGAGFTHTFPVGAVFSVALTCWLVTGAADSDVAEVAADELMAFYTYK